MNRSHKTTLVLSLILLLAGLPAAAADLSGKWKFTWQTEDGPRESVMEFLQQGAKLTAKQGRDELKGTVNGAEFELSGEIYAAEAGYSGAFKMSGKLSGEKLQGEGQWDTHPLSFTAVRVE